MANAVSLPAAAPPPTPTLVGERLRLRPYRTGFQDDELRALYRWSRDEELLSLSGGRPVEMPYPRFRELFLMQLPRHNGPREQLFLVLDENGAAIGRGGLFRIDAVAATAELGIVIGERDRWGRGYGREAVALLRDYGVEELGLAKVCLYTYPDNVRAQRAFEAAGFVSVRQLKRFSFEHGSHWELEMAYEPASAWTP